MEGEDRADQQGDRGRELSDVAAAWSGATYERIAEAFAPTHRRVVETLAPEPGDRFLDLACGTGGVALIAARGGVEVNGLDISPDQLAKARTAAEAEELSIRFDEGDAQALPYADGEFDAVASAFGMIFAPDHARAAAELTRVCRPAGRFAITAWERDGWCEVGRRLRPDYEGVTAHQWAEDGYVCGLFPEAELSFQRGEATISASSADECWQLLSSSVPPLKAWLDTLEPDARENAGREYRQLLGDGSLSREYVLILGTRR
ncbi:MAG: class I SAM-dependent methyltransferase [Verrucomicrobiota bacterium]